MASSGWHRIQILGRVGMNKGMNVVGDRAVTNFSLATDYEPKNGEKVTTWFNCAAWGQAERPGLAGIANDFLQKGKVVLIDGRLSPKINTYPTKDGGTGASYEITVENIVFVPTSSSKDSVKDDSVESDEVQNTETRQPTQGDPLD